LLHDSKADIEIAAVFATKGHMENSAKLQIRSANKGCWTPVVGAQSWYSMALVSRRQD
jgi:hypothetical protein